MVIASYNYARFVGRAIESALGQTRPALEVIVVDDGSTDGSRAVIEGYGARIRAVFKANGGQGSTYNAGFRQACGDAVFLLDSDDELAPSAIETVLRAWRPSTVLLHSRMAMIDERGRPILGAVPAPWVPLAEGDLREAMLRDGGFASALTSGLVLRRDVLARVLPIPEPVFTQGADGYLVRAMAFQGPLQALDLALSLYRRHSENESRLGSSREAIALAMRKRIAYAQNEIEAVRRLARLHGLETAADLGEREPDFLFARLASASIDPARHPLRGDARWALLFRYALAECRRTTSLWRRLAALSLATAIVARPHPFGWRLLNWRTSPEQRPRWLNAMFPGGQHPALRRRSNLAGLRTVTRS